MAAMCSSSAVTLCSCTSTAIATQSVRPAQLGHAMDDRRGRGKQPRGGMSAAVPSGDCHFFLTEAPHRELFVAGQAAARVYELETLASAGEIMLSAETSAAVDPGWLGEQREGAWLMRRQEPGASSVPPPRAVVGTNLEEFVPIPLRAHLAASSGEAVHRQVTVAFVKVSLTDDMIAAQGPSGLLDQLDIRRRGRAGMRDVRLHLARVGHRRERRKAVPHRGCAIELGAGRGRNTARCPRHRRHRLDIPLRAGVNRGHVFTGDIGGAERRTYAVIGDAVNVAARLAVRAQSGEILATTDVLERARTIYATTKEPLLVKGEDRALTAHHVGPPAGTRDDAQATSPRSSVATLSLRFCAMRSTRPACVDWRLSSSGSRNRQVPPRPRALHARAWLHTPDHCGRAVRVVHPFLRLAQPSAAGGGVTPDASSERAGAQLAQLVPVSCRNRTLAAAACNSVGC